MIHHDADGDDDGTYEKFEININDPEGSEKTNTTENDSITGGNIFRDLESEALIVLK